MASDFALLDHCYLRIRKTALLLMMGESSDCNPVSESKGDQQQNCLVSPPNRGGIIHGGGSKPQSFRLVGSVKGYTWLRARIHIGRIIWRERAICYSGS